MAEGEAVSVRDRIKSLRRVKVSELKPNEKNWRTHPPEQADAMRSVLEDIGYADAVLARETKNGLELIDGHLRVDLEKDPNAKIPVLILDVTEDEADKILATHGPLGEMADTDAIALLTLINGIDDLDDDIEQELLNRINDEPDEPAGGGSESKAGKEPPRSLQLLPDHEYVMIRCDDDEEWQRIKTALKLKPVRRGGYAKNSPFDAVGTERIIRAKRLLEMLET